MKKVFNYIIELLRPVFRKIAGWDEVEEQLSTIRYILDNYIDITEFPKATGLLRQCQLADAELLRIVHEILQKHKLQYWLDYGTLLGAVRHKGFIPWDDDLDICMTREEFNKALQILPAELEKFNITFKYTNPGRIAISIWKAGLILDIFCVDSVNADTVKNKADLRNQTIEFRKYYTKHRNQDLTELDKVRGKIIGPACGENPMWYHSVESCADRTVYDNNTIFPLKTIEFEGYQFFAPNDCDVYLREYYGDYMSFPKNGVLHHSGGNNQKITDNPIKYNLDMDEFSEAIKQYKVE